MKEWLKEAKASLVTAAVVSIVSGVVLFMWPETSVRVVCMGLGGVLVLMGLIYLLSYFRAQPSSLMKQVNLIITIILAAVGIWILLRPDSVIRLIPIIIGIVILFHGIGDLQQTIYLGRAKYELWWLALVFAVVTLVLGVVLILNPFSAVSLAVKFIGAFLVFDGISDLWILSRAHHVAKGILHEAEEKEQSH